MKSMNSPIVRLPAITSRPPKKRTAAIPSVGSEEETGQVVRLDRRLPHGLVPHGLGPSEEARPHVLLAAERLHHLDPDDGLVRRLGQVALLRLHEARDREEAVREEPRQHRDRRHRERGDQRQPRVDGDEHDRRAGDHHRALDALDDSPADEVAHGIDVVRGPGDHLAGRVPVEERARVAEVRVVEELAQARLDRDADARGREAAREVGAEADRPEQDDRARGREAAARRAGRRSPRRPRAG